MEKKAKFDLEKRTSKFGESIINFLKNVPTSRITSPLISQLVRSATSVGANYLEANNAESRADFKHKIAICKKESKETVHWFKMIVVAVPSLGNQAKIYYKKQRS